MLTAYTFGIMDTLIEAKGSYDQMGEAYATVVSWIKANGYKINGHMFNIYHVSPAQT